MSLKLPEELVEREIEAICQRYQIDPEHATTLFEQYVQRQPEILKKILAKYPHEDLTRLRSYKTLIKHVRKHIYYHLRQYQADKQKIVYLRNELAQLIRSSQDTRQIERVIQALLFTHRSTKERVNEYQTFYQKIFELIAPPRTILDLGCGIHPLSYPFDHPEYRPEVYVAIDHQPEVIETLTVFAASVNPTRLIPLCADIAEANWRSYLEGEMDEFEVAFMLKLIPVISRQRKHLLPKLAEVPAHQMVITAAIESMTRKENIRRKEEHSLHEFIAMTGRKVLATFQISNEFGYLLGEP